MYLTGGFKKSGLHSLPLKNLPWTQLNSSWYSRYVSKWRMLEKKCVFNAKISVYNRHMQVKLASRAKALGV